MYQVRYRYKGLQGSWHYAGPYDLGAADAVALLFKSDLYYRYGFRLVTIQRLAGEA